jgi:hypothetical protein
MKSKKLGGDSGREVFALIFDQGDEVLATLKSFAADHKLSAASFTGIGAFSEVTIAWFDWQKREYRKIPINEQVEVLMLAGDVSLKQTARRRYTPTSWWASQTARRMAVT